MNLLRWIWSDRRSPPRATAAVARERLTVLLAHEGMRRDESDLLSRLQAGIMAAIQRQVAVQPGQVQVEIHRGPSVTTLAIEIEIPA